MISILIATDNHLGYNEKDPVRGMDSMTAFEEILQIAVKHNVDMILLCGDLFHDNKPSRKTIVQTMQLLRQYTFGDGGDLQVLSDMAENFPDKFGICNFLDPNFNVKIPVFSIHGNHDDPTGDLAALDILSSSGFVNYFGRQTNLDKIDIKPVLLEKNDTRLALYGLGNIRDERLHRLFRQKKVNFYKPPGDWFHLFTLHQNRVGRTSSNYIPHDFLPSFLDIVVWGHEHECKIDLEPTKDGFQITQPGSSVQTSLSVGESVDKHVGILKIGQDDFQYEKIKLKTVRPFLMREVILSKTDLHPQTSEHDLMDYLHNVVFEMIQEANEKWENDCEPPLPLIRLRVEYSGGYPSINPNRFGQQLVQKVANPSDVVLFYRRKVARTKKDDVVLQEYIPTDLDHKSIHDIMSEMLNDNPLQVLPEKTLTNSVQKFVVKEDKDAISEFVDETLKQIEAQVIEHAEDVENPSNINTQIEKARNNMLKDSMDNDLISDTTLPPPRITEIKKMIKHTDKLKLVKVGPKVDWFMVG
ncbi:Metallo-dependent phosphatase-like protein, partial [Gorgonomyces haynaldii]